MSVTCAAGIDVGKFNLDVCIEPSGRRWRVANTAAGLDGLAAKLTRAGVERVVLEAIGPYARSAVAALAAAGLAVGLVNPHRIRGYRAAEGGRAKTDRLDAGLIARFALAMDDPLRPIPSPAAQARKDLAARRRQIVEFIATEKTRLKQASDPAIADSHRALIAALTGQRQEIERRLAASIAAEPGLASRYRLLLSIPGIGPQVATTLITDLPELGTVDRRAIASLAGLAPHPNQSGSLPGRNQIAGGRACVRAALYMASLAATRSDALFKAAYQTIRKDGKPAKVALVAVARKLLVLANTLVRNNVAYDPHHHRT